MVVLSAAGARAVRPPCEATLPGAGQSECRRLPVLERMRSGGVAAEPRRGRAERPEQLPDWPGAPAQAGLAGQLPGEAVLLGAGEQVVVPLPAELAADVGVGEHGMLLSARWAR